MASHGKQRHLKRMAAPLSMGIAHKGGHVWLKKPVAGKHRERESIPLVVFLRERMHFAETLRQAKKLVNAGEVLVDGLKPSDVSIPLGLMDVVSIPKLNSFYRLVFVKGGVLFPINVSAEKAGEKLCRIAGKTMVKKGKIQLNLHDGRVYLIEKEEDRFHPGDTIVLKLGGKGKQELKGFLKMEKGASCYVWKGRHCGATGKLEEIIPRAGSRPEEARLKTEGGEFTTLKDYLFVVDEHFKIS